MTEQEQKEHLKKLLTPEFLATITEVGKLVGWSTGDYSEVQDFIDYLHEHVGREAPNTDPYDVEYDY